MKDSGTIKTLKIISRVEVTRAGQFASLYFPRNHEGWLRSGKCGKNENGSQRGQGLFLWAGGWLAKLEKKGLIRKTIMGHYVVTKDGQMELEKAVE